ncbi:hypothetical protein FCT18_06290 [Lysinibacillus sphaericus]|uniref:PepSY domain-containing protein n=1 Tax=Lysinibacillus sphaericus TaxID=1421 RepID=A0A2S0K2H9_LYSSH|nr:hypothetical protein [Lysinibacillus sphaericus]AVK97528.1 hypothetical protein LS41612_15235 [Lysinibacillus sphaericus]MCS1382463.1 hypothetical protein [Lysinibacillus sphaericus]MED4545952.1 hypothetical protein [Lysinibacillus sphaericus]TKI20222.1 hypothetical protein FCT18_06290 [Lysinibacillus sphaericus]SUV16561.1 Uncharacterised protein [Lysinibacillus sphaericus]
MKSPKILGLALIGILSTGGVTAIAHASTDLVPKNTVMTEQVVEQDNYKANKLKEMALNAFQKNFNETIDTKNFYERNNDFFEIDGHKFYLIGWSNKNSEFVNGNTASSYIAVIDAETNEIVSLDYHPGEPKNQNYKDFSYDEAKDLATNFIKENNILDGKSYEFLEAQSKEVNTAKDAKEVWSYYFYFKYDDGKTCLVHVNKDLKKVTYFMLDEGQAHG